MRLLLILLMCVSFAYGQNDTTKYFISKDYGWQWNRGKFKMLVLPTDTTNNKLGVAQLSNGLYYGNGSKWSAVSNIDTSFLSRYYRKNQTDSAINANVPIYDLQDITSNGYTTTDSIIAASFKRTGGTSNQFLKANGSVDNNTYLTNAVTIVSTTNGLGISSSVANSTTTPNITIAIDTANESILSRQRAATTYQVLLNGTGIVKSTAGTISYLTDNSTNWNTAYTNRITSLTTTGSSGAAILSSNVLNIPTPTVSGLGGIDSIRLVNTGVIFTTPAAFSKVGTTGVITQNLATQTANKFLASPNGSSGALTVRSIVNADLPKRIDSTEKTLPSGLITFTGTTAPSGTTNNTYEWSQNGRVVTFRLNLSYSVAASGITTVVIAIPTDMPAPNLITDYQTANDVMIPIPCNGGNTRTIINPLSANINRNGGTPAIRMVCASQNIQYLQIAGSYFTNN